MRNTTRMAAIAMILVAVAGIVWLFLEGAPQRLGFEDTDNPALMVSFIRQHPETFAQAGMVLVLMATVLTVAVLAVADVLAPAAGGLSLRVTSAFGLFSAAFFLFGGALRVGSSGPLLHMADLSRATGEAAYVTAQVVSQAVLIGGILALCLLAVGLSMIGFRSKALPLPLCALGVLPGYRLASATLGPVGVMPDSELLWLISIASIFGTFLWFVLLGLVLLRRGFRAATAATAAEGARSPEVAAHRSW